MADGYNGLRRINSNDSSLYDPRAVSEAERRAKEIDDINRANETEFYKGLRGGMQGLESAYHGVASMKDALLGDDEGAVRSAERAQRISENAAKLGPTVNDLSQVEDLSSAGSYASGMLGQALPSIVQSLVGAAAGAASAGPVGAAAGATAGLTRGIGTKLALKSLQKIGENYTKKAIRRGVAAGTFASSMSQQAGSMQQNILDPANRAAWEQVQRGERVQDARNGIHGYVYKHIDGDSFWFQPEDGTDPYQIRLPNINTADTGQRGKDDAAARFRSFTDGRRLSHAPTDRIDAFGRRVADVYTDASPESVGRQMLSSGAATVHSSYPGQQDLYKQERIGRSSEGALPNYPNRYSGDLTLEQIAERDQLGNIPDAAIGITGKPLSLREQTIINLLGAGVSAIPDSVLPYHIAQKFGLAGAAKSLVKEELKKAGGVKGILGSTASNVAKEAAKGMPIEGATEGLQTFIERVTSKFIDQNKEVLGEEGINAILNATVAGAIGGLWGGVGGVMPNISAQQLPPQPAEQPVVTKEDSSYDVSQAGMPPETQPGSPGVASYAEPVDTEATQVRAFDRAFLMKPGAEKPYIAKTREALTKLGSNPEAVAQENSLEKAVKNAGEDYKIVSLRNMVEAQAAKEHPGDVQAQQEYVRTYAQQKYEEDSGMRLRQRLDANGKEADRIAKIIQDTERMFVDPDVASTASPEMRSAARDYLAKLKEAKNLVEHRLRKDATKLESLPDHSTLYNEANPSSYLDNFQVAEKKDVTPDTAEFKLSDAQLKNVVRSVSAKYKPTPSQIIANGKSINLRNLVSIVAGQTLSTSEDRGLERNVGDQLLLGLALLQEKGVLGLPKTAPGQKAQMAMRDKLIQRLSPQTLLYQNGAKKVTVEQALKAIPAEKIQSYADTQYQQQVVSEKRMGMTGQELATEDTVERGGADIGSTREFQAPPQEEELGRESERKPDLMRAVEQTRRGKTEPIQRREGPEILRSPMDRDYTNDERRAIAKQRASDIGQAIASSRKDNSVRTAHAMVKKFIGKNALEEMRGQPQGVVRTKALRMLEQAQNKALEDSTKPDSAFLVEKQKTERKQTNFPEPKVQTAEQKAYAKLRANRGVIEESAKAYMPGAVEPASTAQLIAEGDPESLVRENAIAKTWAEKLGIKSEIEIISTENIESMYKRSPDADGLRRRVEAGAQYGIAQFSKGKLSIFIHPRLKDNAARLETLGHELGHAVQRYLYETASVETKEAIFDSFNAFLAKSEGATVDEINKQKKSAATLQARFTSDKRLINDLTPEQQKYLLSFNEWFADQTSRWLTTNKKPMGIVEIFFRRVATTLKRLFLMLQEQGYKADDNVAQFLESIWDANRSIDPVVNLVNELAKGGEKGYHDKLAAAMMHPGVGNYQAAVRLGIHEFLKKPELKVLGQALYTRAMRNKVRSLLQEDKRFGALAEQRRNPEAQLGFAYEYWAADRLKLGPQTEGVFKKLARIVRRFFGFPDDVKQAERVLQAMVEGRVTQRQIAETNELFATSERLSETAVQRATSTLLDLADPVTRMARSLFLTADGQLRSIKNPWTTKLADMFSAELGSQGNKDTYFEDMRKYRTKYLNQVLGIFRNKDEAFGQAFVEAMSKGGLSQDREIAAAQRKVAQMFHDLREYLTSAGVDIGDRGELYWPQVYDLEYLASHHQDLVDLLLQHSSDEFLGGSVEFDPKVGKKVFTPGTNKLSKEQREAAAGRIVHALYNDVGSGDGELHNTKPGQRPFMSAYDLRLMDKEMTGIPQEELAPFLSKDPGHTLQTYVTAAVKRAEFTRRLGRDGERLTQMLNRAKQYGLTKSEEETVNNYVHAMLGTLGADKISPKARKAMGAMMVFQNMRVLALAAFSSLSDPLGIYMRSGDMQTALRAYKAGISSWLADHRGEPDQLHKLAETVGIVDADLTNEALNWEYGGVFLGGTASKLNNWMFKWNGLQDLTKITRLMALDAGKSFLIDHAMNPGKESARYLDQLNLTAEEVRADMVDGKLEGKSEAVQQALVRFVDESILRPNASQRPIWGSDPRFMLVFHLKQFTYSFYNTILKRVYTEYADHGKMAPVMRLMTYIPIMIAADLLRDALKDIGGDGDEDRKDAWTLSDYVWEGTQRAGLLGVGQFAVDAMEAGERGKPFPLPFAGPTAEWTYSLGQAAYRGKMSEWLKDQYPGQNLINPMLESVF